MIHFFVPHRIEGEKIILLLRRHPFVIFTKMLLWLFIAIIPIPVYVILGGFVINLLPPELIIPITYSVTSLFYIYLWVFVFFSFADYYLDVWIVTNERVIDIELHGLFNRTFSEQQLYRIQDITSEMKGFFNTFLSYGNVFIQTAGEQQRFDFKQVPHPDMVAKKIDSLVEENKRKHRLIDSAMPESQIFPKG
ncbi:MAG: PH domain-containing protein [Candidatus Buchananbacteria bacterium]